MMSISSVGVRELVPDRLKRHAREQRGKRAVAFLDEHGLIQQSWTFAELDSRASAIAAELRVRGREGETVALAFPPGLEFVSAFFGCLYAGAVAVPTTLPSPHRVDERMATILADSGARCVLTTDRHRAAVERQVTWSGSGAETLATDALRESSGVASSRERSMERLAFLQYTSGSTRSPRGVMVSHGNLVANLESIRVASGSHPDSVGVSWLPLFHDMGLIGGLLEPMWVGYSALLMAPATFVQSPLRWLQVMSRYRGTIAGGPNFAYQACVDAAAGCDTSDLDLSTWDWAWNGAEPVRPSTLEQFRRVFASAGFRPESLAPGFGLAEATLLVSATARAERAIELDVDEAELGNGRVRPSAGGKRLVSSGPPGYETRIRIVQPDTASVCAPGRVGEIWVDSGSVGQGYWQKSEESLATFGARLDTGEGPFLRTGDLGFLYGGELFVTGRLKDVLVLRGVKYYPQDIESTIEASHPALAPGAGVVVGLEEAWTLKLVAVSEIRRSFRRSVDTDEVVDAIRRAVAREHQLALHGVVLLPPFKLPKTSSGKVQRARCRMALQEKTLSPLSEWWAPALRVAPIDFTGEPLEQPGVLERQLVDWLQRELSLTNLGWKTPLMELGIDSLKGVELGNALSEAFHHSFSATLLIDHPSIESLARLIREEVLNVKAPSPVAKAVSSVDEKALADEMALMGEDEMELLLRRRIEDVLGGGSPT